MIMIVNVVQSGEGQQEIDPKKMKATLKGNTVTIISGNEKYELQIVSQDRSAKKALKEFCETVNAFGDGVDRLKIDLVKRIREGESVFKFTQDKRGEVKIEYANPGSVNFGKAGNLNRLDSLVKAISSAKFFQFMYKRELRKDLKDEIKKFNSNNWSSISTASARQIPDQHKTDTLVLPTEAKTPRLPAKPKLVKRSQANQVPPPKPQEQEVVKANQTPLEEAAPHQAPSEEGFDWSAAWKASESSLDSDNVFDQVPSHEDRSSESLVSDADTPPSVEDEFPQVQIHMPKNDNVK